MQSDLDKLATLGVNVSSSPEGLEAQETNQQEEAPVVEDKKENVITDDNGSSLTEEKQTASESNTQQSQSNETDKQVESDGFGEIVDLSTNPTETVQNENAKKESNYLDSLNEKFGTSFKSDDDLAEVIRKSNESQAAENKQVEAFKRFTEETGRGLWDFVQTQIDYTKMPDSELAIRSLMESDGLNRENAEILFQDEFEKIEIDESMMTDSEIATAKRKNAAIDAKIARQANKYRKDMEAKKEKYKLPEDGWVSPSERQKEEPMSKEEVEAFSNSMKESLSKLKEFKIEVDKDKAFKFSTAEFLDTNSDSLTNPETAFQKFLKDDGETWDTDKLSRAIMLDSYFDKIIKSVYRNAYGQGMKKPVEAGKNLNYNQDARRGAPNASTSNQAEQDAVETVKRHLGRNGMRIKI